MLGRIADNYYRWVVSIPCRRNSPSRGPRGPYKDIIFIVDTGSPFSYLCEEAMQVLLPEGGEGHPIPESMMVELFPTQATFKFDKSIRTAHFADVNILGGNVLLSANVQSIGASRQFKLTFPLLDQIME